MQNTTKPQKRAKLRNTRALPNVLCHILIGHYRKGIVSRDDIFLESPRNQISAFYRSTDGFHNICLSFVEETKNKVSGFFYEITY
jgi:hypothetical protein